MNSIGEMYVRYDESSKAQAQALASRLGIEYVATENVDESVTGVYLEYLSQGLSLCDSGKSKVGPTCVDFHDAGLARRVSDSMKQQNLIKALGLKKLSKPRVLDAMAGLGKDAFLMASAGCSVQMLEKSHIVHALLEDGLARLSGGAGTSLFYDIALQHSDFLNSGFSKSDFDVVYLDPMYSIVNRKSRAKKDMDRLHDLVGMESQDPMVLDPVLLEKAFGIADKRVIIKRPKNAPNFAGRKPEISYSGSSARFDVYLCS